MKDPGPSKGVKILKPLLMALNDLRTHVNILARHIQQGKETPDRTEFRDSLYEVQNTLSRIKQQSFGSTVQGLMESIKLYEEAQGRELTGFVRRTVTAMYEDA